MGISRKHLNTHEGIVEFDPNRLAEAIKARYPDVVFCLLLGSAVDGTVRKGSDVDLAFYLKEPASLDFYSTLAETVDEIIPDVRCDIGLLNRAEPVFRFEALKGKLLFSRDMEQYAAFFSLTCREYESQMFDYERQRRYRRACHAAS
jgi:predicted nucleotidyltransferase